MDMLLCVRTVGFYCFYRPAPGENVTKDTPVCPNITGVATQHAKWLTEAGFDYVRTSSTSVTFEYRFHKAHAVLLYTI
mgnify:CR=1 FL=1